MSLPRRHSLLAAVSVLFVLAAPPLGAADNEDVLAPIQAMFDGMAARDGDAIRGAALPGTMLILMRDGKPSHMTIEAFAATVAKPSNVPIAERMHDPLVRVDHDLAMVWAPFEFLADGKIDHCGTDLFNLVQIDGKWFVAGVADTGSKICAKK